MEISAGRTPDAPTKKHTNPDIIGFVRIGKKAKTAKLEAGQDFCRGTCDKGHPPQRVCRTRKNGLPVYGR